MSEQTVNAENITPTVEDQKPTPDIDALVAQRVDESLKEIKTKLDKAYGARDEALKKAEALEAEKRQAEIARLAEEGKHKEAYEMQLADERAKRETAERRNTELTRDMAVRNALSQHPVKTQRAAEMAFSEIVRELVQDKDGNWVHKTGTSIETAVKSFAENDDNAFLFKQKQSSGGGTTPPSTTTPPAGNRSLFSMSQEEVLKLAAEGKLRG
jgi:membrane protein involved in colicin uptake